jgi:hypothetical protein
MASNLSFWLWPVGRAVTVAVREGWTAFQECVPNRPKEIVSGQVTDLYLGLAHPGLDHRVVMMVEGRIIAESARHIADY